MFKYYPWENPHCGHPCLGCRYFKPTQVMYSNSKLGSYNGVVNGNCVNVRSGPGTNYPVLFQVNKGVRVNVMMSQEDWLYIMTYPGNGEPGYRYGWIYAQYVTPLI